MDKLQNLIALLAEAGEVPGKTVKKSGAHTGKEPVGCFPIYTPEEIVYAAGYLPVGMWGGQTELKLADTYLQGFCCSIMRANIEFGMRGTYDSLKAVLIPTLCDTLKCICENWKVAVPQVPVIPVVYPQNRLNPGAEEYMVTEFIRVKTELEKLKGEAISDEAVEEAFEIYEEYRSAMREFTKTARDYLVTLDVKTRHLIIKSALYMDKKEYTEIISELTAELKSLPPEKFKGIKAVATGLVGEPAVLLNIFNENNIAFTADDFAQESRQFRTKAREAGTAYEKMAGRIADQRGCTFLYEEQKTKGQMLIEMIRETGAEALVVFMMKFCDPEEFDYPIYKEEMESAGIPVLYIEIDQQMDSAGPLRNRIQGFAEMLL